MKAAEKKWCASNYTNSITLKKLTSDALRFPRGTYHDTWEEAHAALVARREREFAEAERRFQNARAALGKAKRMPPPASSAVASGSSTVNARRARPHEARPDEQEGPASPSQVPQGQDSGAETSEGGTAQ